jgi:hypothetical protein
LLLLHVLVTGTIERYRPPIRLQWLLAGFWSKDVKVGKRKKIRGKEGREGPCAGFWVRRGVPVSEIGKHLWTVRLKSRKRGKTATSMP